MPTHSETRRLAFPRETLFDIVADVDRYQDFLPWCVASRVTRRDGAVILGDLMIGYKAFRETFTSRVTLERPDRIEVEYIDGPFEHLVNHWTFRAAGSDAADIDFHVDFRFKSDTLSMAIAPVFSLAVKRMVGAFEARAVALNGRTAGKKGLQLFS